MWRLVREGCRFYRSAVLISWAFGVGIFLLVITLVAILGSVNDRSELPKVLVQMPISILIASMIAGFIVTGRERGESRVRMHAMLPLPVGQIAVARVLVPAAPLIFGLALSHVVFGALLALDGTPFAWSRHLTVDFIGFQLLLWVQVALAVREVIELHKAGRRTAAIAWAAALIAAIAFVLFFQVRPLDSRVLKTAGVAMLNLAIMTFTVSRFCRRTVFTK